MNICGAAWDMTREKMVAGPPPWRTGPSTASSSSSALQQVRIDVKVEDVRRELVVTAPPPDPFRRRMHNEYNYINDDCD